MRDKESLHFKFLKYVLGAWRSLGEVPFVSFWFLRVRVQSSPTWSKMTIDKRRCSRGHLAPVSPTPRQAPEKQTPNGGPRVPLPVISPDRLPSRDWIWDPSGREVLKAQLRLPRPPGVLCPSSPRGLSQKHKEAYPICACFLAQERGWNTPEHWPADIQ